MLRSPRTKQAVSTTAKRNANARTASLTALSVVGAIVSYNAIRLLTLRSYAAHSPVTAVGSLGTQINILVQVIDEDLIEHL